MFRQNNGIRLKTSAIIAIVLLMGVLFINLFGPSALANQKVSPSSFSNMSSAPSAQVNLKEGDARTFSNPPNTIAYANTEYVSPPSEYSINTGGSIWRSYEWIALMDNTSWIEARTSVATTSVGIQFWGDTNDGWARVLVDGVEVWTGDTHGSDSNYPGGAFVKYLEISNLLLDKHTIRVENMGTPGVGAGDDVTILFFGLEKTSGSSSGAGSSPRLVAYYPFNGDSNDYSGNNNHGAIEGNLSYVSAAVDRGARFDGQSFVKVADSNSLDLYNAFTFSAWLYKEDAGPGGYSVILSKGDTSAHGNNSPYALAHSADGLFPMLRLTNNNYSHISSGTRADFGQWYFLVVAWDGANVKFYINGSLTDTKTWNSTLPNSSAQLLIGCDPPGSTEYFKGIIDELRIYNYALNSGEIETLYREGKVGSVPTPSPTPTPIPQPGLSPTPSPSPTSPPSASTSGSLVFESRSKPSGSEVQIPLTLTGANQPIGNMDIALAYDPGILTATDAIKGGLTANSLFDFNMAEPGIIKISLADKTGFSEGEGSVAYIRFNVIGAVGTSSPLRITNLSANRISDFASLEIGRRDGKFTVIGSNEGLGDSDGDGVLTALDALVALQMAVGKRAEDLIMDVNGDGKVTSLDASQILQKAVSSGMETPKMPGEATSQGNPAPATGTAPPTGNTAQNMAYPHLQIVGVDYELIPWVSEKIPTSTKPVCDYFRIKLKFTIENKGEADFPPGGVTGRLDRGGILFWTILYDGKNSKDTMTNEYRPYSFWYHNELDIPAGGRRIIEREFRVATDLPLNPFKVVAWFHPPITEPGARQESEIPPPNAPVIEQPVPIPGGTRISLKLDQKPFVSDDFELEGPDIYPVRAFYLPLNDKPGHYDIGFIFENSGIETAGSVQVSLSVPIKNPTPSTMGGALGIYEEIQGPFPTGKHVVIACDRGQLGEPDFENASAYVILKCPESSQGIAPVGDVDHTNDSINFKDVIKEKTTNPSLSELTKGCVTYHFIGCKPF